MGNIFPTFLNKAALVCSIVSSERGQISVLNKAALVCSIVSYERGQTSVLNKTALVCSIVSYERGQTSVLNKAALVYSNISYERGQTNVLNAAEVFKSEQRSSSLKVDNFPTDRARGSFVCLKGQPGTPSRACVLFVEFLSQRSERYSVTGPLANSPFVAMGDRIGFSQTDKRASERARKRLGGQTGERVRKRLGGQTGERKSGNMADQAVEGEKGETWQPRRRVWPQHTAALLATLCAMSGGIVMGWSTPAVPYLQEPHSLDDGTNATTIPITDEEGSWLGSLSAVGALLGAMPAGFLSDMFGRKRMLLILAVPLIISWIMLMFVEQNIILLYVARLISGIGLGGSTVISPIYNEEIADVEIRGSLGTYCEVMLYTKKSKDPKNKTPLFQKIRKSVQSISTSSPTFKAAYIVFGLMFLQQMSGTCAFMYYTVNVFRDAGTTLSPHLCSIIVAFVQLVGGFSASRVVDHAGRRPLLLFSGSSLTVCLATMSIYTYLNESEIDVSQYSWVPLLALNVFVVSFEFGMGTLPWLMMAELAPSESRGFIAGGSVCLNWILVFLVTKCFTNMIDVMGLAMTYGTYCICMFLGIFFVWFLVPETNGKTREQIQHELKFGKKAVS
uniref:Sugar transporter n=1 Tax=Timema tahoe TaxID=61484 RepID=A0A7R9IMI7_9NEOP|nr:unnamed protein product [Timema tahoe]